ncbi:endo-1,4-beta-xylanase Z [Maribacter sp. ANRC-HE7]|uniref:Endo-1,4-beta-xylanase Z n=1 Tax=Maribacter aquimaris TaxID=2737171 RepID=A0ABR7V306_9FLAO|nr:alpha/beta hydrolase-fold protein [Maribacter aquimaris]MBD0778720.1 endo-1,4-beta-xylanase Z [Maribacter aquimaris]
MRLLIVSLFCLIGAQTILQGQYTPNDSLTTTEVLPGNKAIFRIFAPQAKSVKLSSDDRWENIEFKKNTLGIWEGTWKNVTPGLYRYRFIVDSVNVYDPQAPAAKNNPALLVISSGDDFFDMKDNIPHGAIAQRFYYSNALKQTRRLHVWTPAGNEKSKEQLPVFYLVHGGGDTDISWSKIGAAGNILDNLLAEGEIEPMIVVMPNGNFKTEKILDRVPLFKDDMMTGVIPFIESNYNVYTDSAHRAIMGLSLGGLQTLEIVMTNYDDFDYINILSSGWWISDTWARERGVIDDKVKRAAHLKQIAADFNTTVKLLYFTQGGPEDLAYENGMETLKLFDAAGIKYKYSEAPGGHTWMVWRQNLRNLAPLLFK